MEPTSVVHVRSALPKIQILEKYTPIQQVADTVFLCSDMLVKQHYSSRRIRVCL